MQKLTELQFEDPEVIIEVYKGFNEVIWKQTANDPTRLYFFFLTKEQVKTWKQLADNMLATKEDNALQMTSDKAERIIQSIWSFDHTLLTKGIVSSNKGFTTE